MPDADFSSTFNTARSEATLLVLFIPSADRHGQPLGKTRQQRWVRKALKLLGENLRGGTAYPRGWGVWRDDARGGVLVWDRPVVIQCFTNQASLAEHAKTIEAFLRELGRKTRQGAVGFVVDRGYYEYEFPLEGE
jgi:hypothetical protein